MDLLERRDIRTKRRKKDKARYDSEYNLAYHDEKKLMFVKPMKLSTGTQRLLDEGAIVGDGYIDFYIQKGTLEKFLNGENVYLDNLPSDFVGSVNLGHMDFATFPFVIGEWTKEDLTLTDNGDGRKGLDVNIRLDEESVFVKELKRMPYDIGISAEFGYHVNRKATEDVGFLVVDEVCIFAYGLVGECGNVNSSGLELKGDNPMDENRMLDFMEEEETISETETVETSDEIEETEGEETLDFEDGVEDEVADDEDDPEDGEVEEDGEEEVDELSAVMSAVNDLRAEVETLNTQIEALTTENAELKKTNKRLSRKLKDEKAKKAAFVENFKNVAEKLGEPEKEPEQRSNYYFGDGIGE